MAEKRGRHDRWIKCISNSGSLRGVALNVTGLAREITDLHQLTPDGTKALAEALVAGFLYASFCKPGERANLNLQGDGWVKQALVDAYPEGHVRGYVIENTVKSVTKGEGPWGEGFLSVLRTKGIQKTEPYIGTVPLVTGFLAKDLTFYWHQSEQLPSAVGIAVKLDVEGKIEAAGGFLVQALPGATPDEIRELNSRVLELAGFDRAMTAEVQPMDLLTPIFQDMAFMILETRDLRWECQCSWDRIARGLILIGVEELKAIVRETGSASVRCDFCTKEYTADRSTLEEMISKLEDQGGSSSS